MKVNCYFPGSSSFTVGEVRLLTCKGDIPSLSPPLKTGFQEDSKKYALHVLETVSVKDNEINLRVTGYQTGSYKAPFFWLTDGKYSLSVEGLSWNIPSVLTSETGPYPPYGPWKIKIPLWYDLSWIFLLLAISIFGVFKFKKHRMRIFIQQRIADRLEDKTPVQYFIHELSSVFLLKKNSENFLIHLQKSFRTFLENQFNIPLETPCRKVLKHKSIDKPARQILSELEAALKNQYTYSETDGEQLLNMVRNWIFQYGNKQNHSTIIKEKGGLIK